MMGTVIWYEAEKGYGFIAPDGGGADMFVHHSAVSDCPGAGHLAALTNGQRVVFDVVRDQKNGRPKAANVRSIRL